MKMDLPSVPDAFAVSSLAEAKHMCEAVERSRNDSLID